MLECWSDPTTEGRWAIQYSKFSIAATAALEGQCPSQVDASWRGQLPVLVPCRPGQQPPDRFTADPTANFWLVVTARMRELMALTKTQVKAVILIMLVLG